MREKVGEQIREGDKVTFPVSDAEFCGVKPVLDVKGKNWVGGPGDLASKKHSVILTRETTSAAHHEGCFKDGLGDGKQQPRHSR